MEIAWIEQVAGSSQTRLHSATPSGAMLTCNGRYLPVYANICGGMQCFKLAQGFENNSTLKWGKNAYMESLRISESHWNLDQAGLRRTRGLEHENCLACQVVEVEVLPWVLFSVLVSVWRFSIHSQINSLTLAVESLRIDPGKELGPVPVEAGLDGGAVVVVVVLKVPQPVAVPRPVTIELVCPVVPGESPSLNKFSLLENKERLLADLIGKIKTAVSSLCDKTSDAKSLNLAPPLIFGLKLIWGNVLTASRSSLHARSPRKKPGQTFANFKTFSHLILDWVVESEYRPRCERSTSQNLESTHTCKCWGWSNPRSRSTPNINIKPPA